MIGINSEREFEEHLRNDILTPLLAGHSNFELYDFKRAVDILIVDNRKKPKLNFIEVKYHKLSHGRLGFGHGRGAGFQPEMLRRRSPYFETNLRWILGSERHEQYWWLDNSVVCNYLNGDSVGVKYNGIKLRLFRDIDPISRLELEHEIKSWLNIA